MTLELVERMKLLDELAFSEFFSLFAIRVRSYLKKRGLHPSEIDELSQNILTDTSIAIAEGKFEFRDESSLERWVFTCARNEFFKFRKSRQDNSEMNNWESLGEVVRQSKRPDQKNVHKSNIQWALAQLAPIDREILALRIVEQQMTFAEIGRRIEVSEQNARVRFFRAKKKLEKLLLSFDSIRKDFGNLLSSDDKNNE
jgi:RNA polymerase sigma factor (sigma-70 family)